MSEDVFGIVYDAERAFGVQFGSRDNLNTYCPFHGESRNTSRTPSCSVNSAGMFSCKVCKAHGTAVDFYAKRKNISVEEAEQLLSQPPTEADRKEADRRKYMRRANPTSSTLSDALVQRCQKMLQSNGFFQRYLKERRGISDEVIRLAEIGCDESRITYPVRVNGKLTNIRRYLPNAKSTPKMVTHEKGDGTPSLYPDFVFDSVRPGDEVIICEGENDALLLISQGFKAFTHTGGVAYWDEAWTQYIVSLAGIGVRFAIVFDVNDPGGLNVEPDLGQRKAQEHCKSLVELGVNAKVVRLPIDITGGDITDWFITLKRSAKDLQTLMNSVPYPFDIEEAGTEPTPDNLPEVPNPASKRRSSIHLSEMEPTETTLHDASKADFFRKTIAMRCLVAGRSSAPYLVPKQVKVQYVDKESGDKSSLVLHFDRWDDRLLAMMQCSNATLKRIILAAADLVGAEATLHITETWNVEEVFLIPTIDSGQQYTLRKCFFIGHGIRTNEIYDFVGYTLPHPQTQEATHFLVTAKPATSGLDGFEIDEATHAKLVKTFQPTDGDVHRKLLQIADNHAKHVTHIRGRRDLHLAVDLWYHSVLSFNFDRVPVRKGWLEVLVIGDTRTGKGCVAEGLARFYGVGDVVSGENVTLAGLIGGVQRVGDRWSLVWGKIPLNDRRAVIIDEASSLRTTDIGAMSRVRSEGVAEITKVISEKTTARTRLLWLSNPRPTIVTDGKPRMMSSYTYGIEAVPELVGTAEDVARFDYVLTVAQDEVPTDLINQRQSAGGRNPYPADLCKTLITWAWSRTPKQIMFEDGVVDMILRAAKQLGNSFSSRICLVQSEDVRFKLARIACAAAARTYSTPDGVNLHVTQAHVEFAFNLLHHIYGKPSCGYAYMSSVERENTTLKDAEQVYEALCLPGDDNIADLVSGILSTKAIRVDDICDFCGTDPLTARTIISILVRQRALIKCYAGYEKSPAFRSYLTRLKQEFASDTHPTQEDSSDGTDQHHDTGSDDGNGHS